MPIARVSLSDLHFAASLRLMSDEDFLDAWQGEVIANDEPRIALVEPAATQRFGLSTWHHRYAARFPDQTRYRLPDAAVKLFLLAAAVCLAVAFFLLVAVAF